MKFIALVVVAHLPSQSPINLGVLVLDEVADRLHFRFRKDLVGVADPLDREVIQGLPGMIESMAAEMGAVGLLQFLENTASNSIRVGERLTIHADTATEAVELAFAEHAA